jgi:hypothetical protein
MIRPDGQHGGKTDGGVHGIASAHPIPESEHVRGIDAELGYFLLVGRDRDEMFCNRFFVAAHRRPAIQARAEWAFVIVSSVVNVFDEIMKSVSVGSRPWTASAKSVPSTLETNRNVMARSL